MVATMIPLDLPIPLSDVVLYVLLSGVVGLLLYGIFTLLKEGPSDGSEESDGKRRRRGRAPVRRLDATGWTLLVDGSNFAHRNRSFRPVEVRLRYLQEVLAALEHRFENADIQVYCDANLRYLLEGEDRRKFLELVECPDADFYETHGKQADDVLLKHARSNRGCIVVSNDRFGDEDQLMARIRVPLLKVKTAEWGVRLSDKVDIYLDPDRPFKKSWIPLGRLINPQARPN